MKLWEIVEEERKKMKLATIEASNVDVLKKQKEKEFSRGEIRIFKKTGEKITIMAGAEESDSEVNVVFNKTGRRGLVKKDDTEEFVNPKFK